MTWIDDHIRDVPDFPVPGILFKDISPLVRNPDALARAVDELAELFPVSSYDQLVAIEARGFLFGAALAYKLRRGCTLIRKKGKLPADTIQLAYALEYGEATIEMQSDGLEVGQRVLLVDDLLATGGTIAAAADLARRAGAEVVGAAFLIELAFLEAARKLDFPTRALRTY